MSSYAEAGIRQYCIEAVLDEQTTNICRYLYVDDGAGRTELAEITRSAIGIRDELGDFRVLASDRALNEIGISFLPYYGLCCAARRSRSCE